MSLFCQQVDSLCPGPSADGCPRPALHPVPSPKGQVFARQFGSLVHTAGNAPLPLLFWVRQPPGCFPFCARGIGGFLAAPLVCARDKDGHPAAPFVSCPIEQSGLHRTNDGALTPDSVPGLPPLSCALECVTMSGSIACACLCSIHLVARTILAQGSSLDLFHAPPSEVLASSKFIDSPR